MNTDDMKNYYNKDSIVNIYAYPPYPFESKIKQDELTQAAAQVAVDAVLLINIVEFMLCGIAHMEGWHDHHSIFSGITGVSGTSIEKYVNEYTPTDCNGVKPQPSEPAFLYSVLRNKDIGTQPQQSFYRPGGTDADGRPIVIDIYKKDIPNNNNTPTNFNYDIWLRQFDTKLQERYIICSVTLNKTGDDSKIQQCFTENGINEDIFICRDVAYGNVAYDIKRWGPNSVNSKVTKVYNVQTASGVYDPGPSVSYDSDAGKKCGYQDIAGEEGISNSKGNSRYCLFNDSESNEQITTYPAFGKSTMPNSIMESPEEMMYSKFNSQLFGENLASYYANKRQPIDKKDAQSIIDSSQVNLVVEYKEPIENQEGEIIEQGQLYIVNKHSSSKATSMLDLPFICSCLKYSAAVDAIDIVKKRYPFKRYMEINQSGPLKIMTKKFGDSGIALQTLRNKFNFYSFEPTIINTNQTNPEKKVTITSKESNGIHAFLSYDQVAIGAALEYGCPVVMYNVNQTLTGNHGGVLLFISKKIKDKFSDPNKIRTELNSKIATAANTKLLDDTDVILNNIDVKLTQANIYAQNIISTLTDYMTRMNNIVSGLMKWNSSKKSALYDIWYQNYLRLASIITKHASQVSSVMKLIKNLESNYPNIISIGDAAQKIYNDTNGPINQYATADAATVAAAAAAVAGAADAAAIAVANGTSNTYLDGAVAAAVAAAGVNNDDSNYNLKKSNVVLKVILDNINAAIQLEPQINKITEKLTLIERTLTIEVGAIENADTPYMIKSFRKNVKFTNDIILNRCNPFSGLGNARRMRTVRTFFNNPNGLDPSAVELGLVIIKQCFDDLIDLTNLVDLNGNSVTFENDFTQQIQSLFGDFYRVANTKGLKPTYRLALTGIPDGYQDRFMDVRLDNGETLKQRYDDSEVINTRFGGEVGQKSKRPDTTESFESIKSSKSSEPPLFTDSSSKSSKSPTVLTVPTESTENDKKRSENLLSELIKEIGNMIKKTQEKMKKVEDLKVSIIKEMENYSYAELPDDIIAKSEKIDSIVDGFNALIELLTMVKEFINKKGTNYIKHSNKPGSYEFLQARMQLYQVFFVISFLQTLNQYQTSKPNKPQISNSNKSGGGERSQTQTGGFRESKIKGMLKSKLTTNHIGHHSIFNGGSSNIIMSFDFDINSKQIRQITKTKRVSNGDNKTIQTFSIIFTQNIENFSPLIINAEFTLKKNENSWGLYCNNNFIFNPPDLPLDNDNEAVNTFNNTYMLFMGYVITIEHYENLLNIVRPDVLNKKSNLLYINDLSEATNLSRVVKYYDDNGYVKPIALDVTNESLDDGGNIMDTIFGEENSEKYDSSLAGNGELYTLFGILANATHSFFKDNFYFEQPWINNQDPLINNQDAEDMITLLLQLLVGDKSGNDVVNELVNQGLTTVNIETMGGKAKKAKKTKKKRKQKKHTKKLKYRKKSTKSPRKTEKKRK